jgi:threonine aldolase
MLPLEIPADFRSDTVTKPTAAMGRAMASVCGDGDAAVGDDVMGEDSTIKALESHAASLLGKEAAVFVPTCTMANLLAVGSHCARGDEVFLGTESHIFVYEQGGAAWLMGTVFHPIINAADGTLPLDALRAALATRAAASVDAHFARPALICVENTSNRCGGSALPPAYLDALAALAREHALPLHCDGARLFNAAAALGVPPATLAAGFSSVSICLSKGLGAPLGALLVGDAAVIAKARRLRKAVGGGMRQAGVVAAAGLVALTDMPSRLPADHVLARSLADALRRVPGLVPQERVDSNIVYTALSSDLTAAHWVARAAAARVAGAAVVFDKLSGLSAPVDAVPDGATPTVAFSALLRAVANVKVGGYGTSKFRAVTHHQVDARGVAALAEGAAVVARLMQAE